MKLRCLKDNSPLLQLENTKYFLCPKCGLWYSYKVWTTFKKRGFGVYDAKEDRIYLPMPVRAVNRNSVQKNRKYRVGVSP